ncbi:hypothetical protein C2S53_001248 [Perilla frutescens var. hirtella]|uniref:Aminotransferase-like plant mobile domain-containing protein n=1 Tax=Perilla frutescens var. hirtella TaxID=608512 RepID=A0AAD4IZD2_PERFH|nr:hypothetical protein C2S53_001248 [Perilla frutescens var. hirtella]
MRYEEAAGNEGGDMPNDEDDANNEDDDDEILRGPFPGGPIDTSVLRSFKTHVAAAIWRGEEREVLKCHCLTAKLLRWQPPEDSSIAWKTLVKKSGLLRLRKLAYRAPNRNLVSAFMERWHPETNSFHLPFGEMSIILEYVYCLTGLSIKGRPVEFAGEDIAGGQHMVRRLLGVSAEEADAEVSERGSYIKLKWLHSRFSVLASSEDNFEVVYTARAFLVYILGCTLFTDKTGDRITCNYLRLFEDPEEFEGYAWGVAALAFLYRQLGVGSRVGCRQMAGFLTLLDAWIYEHFPTLGRPQQNTDYRPGQPFAMRWAQQAHGAVSEDAVRAYRLQLDTLRAEDVVWDPYVKLRDGGERPEVTFYEGCITACDIVEPYLPDRVLRQFGRGMLASFYEQWESHKLARERQGRVAYPSWACSPDYQQWYEFISHPRVQPEAAAPVVDPQMTVSPCDGIQSAIGYLKPVLTRWRAHDQDLSLPYVMSQVEESFEALHFRTGHEQSETHSHREHEQGESSSRRRRRRQ